MRAKEIVFPRSVIFNKKLEHIKKEIYDLLCSGYFNVETLDPSKVNIFASQLDKKEFKNFICFTHPSQGKASVEFKQFSNMPVIAKLRDRYYIVDGHHRMARAAYSKKPIKVYLVDLPDNI